jgi:NAD(P)-dependent dehydrogenase (short-subunit alcohol dehydrogenase family)
MDPSEPSSSDSPDVQDAGKNLGRHPDRAFDNIADPSLLPFTMAEQDVFLKVIKAFAADESLWTQCLQIKTAVMNTSKQMLRSKKRKTREEDKEKINSVQINQRRKLTIEHDKLLDSGVHRLLLEHELPESSATEAPAAEEPIPTPMQDLVVVKRPIKCYICKKNYTKLHFFYNQMCPECAEFNWTKRNQSADLSGRVAIVTGGRIKIGYEVALKLLRCGATVIVTSRFPKDAALRFAKEKDSSDWISRLDVFGLDMRHLRSVEQFCQYVSSRYQKLDIIINNAAMTIRRPPAFYKHMMPTEMTPFESLPPLLQPLLAKHHDFETKFLTSHPTDSLHIESLPIVSQTEPEPASANFGLPTSPKTTVATSSASPSNEVSNSLDGKSSSNQPTNISSAALSQIAVMDEDIVTDEATLFPKGHYDEHHQQMDYRDKNSWVLELEDVQTPELLEVLAINAVSPFILNSKLKPLLDKSDFADKHVINVSAMEGKFTFSGKTTKHPHTNCAKASLNMMTRTAAAHYLETGIFMNAVETGWITENLPNPEEDRIRHATGYASRIPLDEIDGAARILDPIFTVIHHGSVKVGKFWKNYVVVDW